jgi:hypothetical protein
VENSRQWALGPNHPIVNRFLGSLTKFDAHEWIAVLQAHSSPSGRLVAEVEAAATNAGRGSAVANARRVSKQFVAYNHWAGQRWQDRVVSILAEAGSRLNAVEVEFLVSATTSDAASALVALDLLPVTVAEQAISPFRGTSAELPERDGLHRETLLIQSAFAGDTGAMMQLAEESARHADTAGQILWLEMAADSGLEASFVALGKKFIDTGKHDDAHRWLSRAAGTGSTEAMLMLRVEADRWGDHGQADRWLQIAAEAGSTDAMRELGHRIHNDVSGRLGLTLDERIEQATTWYTRAANAGDTYAMRTLAMWAESDGDTETAARWRARAGAAGDS